MNSILPVDAALLDRLLAEAGNLPRLRKNFNFHEHDAHPCQRLLNAILPGSYVRPHRHLAQAKDEFMVVLRGSLGIVFFDADGAVSRTVTLAAGGATCAVSVPSGVFHSVLALVPAVMFEAKAGPYEPLTPDELAPFAPAEGSPGVSAYLRRMEVLFAPV